VDNNDKRSIKTAEPLIFVTAFLLFFWTFIYDISIIPASKEQGFVYILEIATINGVICLVALAIVAALKPSALSIPALNVAAVACAILGATFSFIGLTSNSALFYVGVSLIDISLEWALVKTCLAMSLLGSRQRLACTALAALAGYLLALLASYLPLSVPAALFVACPTVMVVIIDRRLSGLFRTTLNATPDAAVDSSPGAAPNSAPKSAPNSAPKSTVAGLRITRPYAWLPPTNNLFMSFLFFMGLFGFAVQTGSIGNGPVSSIVALGLVIVIGLVTWRSFKMDFLYQLPSLFLMFGVFIALLPNGRLPDMQNAAFAATAISFYVLEMLVLANLAAHNQTQSLSFVAWGNAVCLLGTTLGSLCGHIMKHLAAIDADYATAAAIVLAMAFLAYVLINLKNFSFTEIIAHADSAEVSIDLPSEAFDRACRRISEKHRLTQREMEILGFLARGRNSIVIERELMISRNTIKTHVRHIYEKLGCHKQQDLIDLIAKNL
jgi:DNA-binding CsgD family transcriptional regulator